jgi:hypothetical protein
VMLGVCAFEGDTGIGLLRRIRTILWLKRNDQNKAPTAGQGLGLEKWERKQSGRSLWLRVCDRGVDDFQQWGLAKRVGRTGGRSALLCFVIHPKNSLVPSCSIILGRWPQELATTRFYEGDGRETTGRRGMGICPKGQKRVAATGTVAHNRCDDPDEESFEPTPADIPIGRST